MGWGVGDACAPRDWGFCFGEEALAFGVGEVAGSNRGHGWVV